MKIGTKSVLYGAHCFFLHPWFVAAAWWKLYGFPWDPRLWAAFFLHDIGYIGSPNMDGPEGEKHVELGARIMQFLFGWMEKKRDFSHVGLTLEDGSRVWLGPWAQFCLFHSRYYAKKYGFPFSRLCVADKLAITLTPAWLYLPMVRWTGEIHEYLSMAYHADMTSGRFKAGDYRGREKEWHDELCRYMREWVEAHKDGSKDTWTSANRHPQQEQTPAACSVPPLDYSKIEIGSESAKNN